MTDGRMRYPERASTETDRDRRERLALQSSVARRHEHERRFGRRGRAFPQGIPVGRVEASASALTMDATAWRSADFGQVCQVLGLRPSRPHETAAGKRARRSRRSPSRVPAAA